jgi:hypothetical protein
MRTKMPLPAEKKFFTVQELLAFGFSYYKINKLVEHGYLIKRNKKLYENTSFAGEESDYSTVAAYVPNGIERLHIISRRTDRI